MTELCLTEFYKSFRHFFCIMMLSQQDRPLTPPTLGQYWPHVGTLVSRSVCFARAVLFFPSLIDYLKVLSIFGESPQICLFSKQDIFVYSCFCLFRMFGIKGGDYSNLFN